ncbi:MAG: carboxypeptidase-like regulatory domain-containing protein, partial [Ginsengibacter sp.]
MKLMAFIICTFLVFTVNAQKNPAYVSGKVTDENDDPLPGVSVTILGSQSGIVTNDSGTFRLKVAA